MNDARPPLDHETMLAYFMAADKTADTWFRTAVVTTRIYCRPSCRARKPLPRNVLFFGTAAEARQAGFRACRRCRPDDDAAEGEDLLARVADIVGCAETVPSVRDVAERLGMSERHLRRRLREVTGAAPKRYLDRLVLARAVRLLRDPARRILDVAMESGYGSASAFDRAFRAVHGTTASAWRATLALKEK